MKTTRNNLLIIMAIFAFSFWLSGGATPLSAKESAASAGDGSQAETASPEKAAPSCGACPRAAKKATACENCPCKGKDGACENCPKMKKDGGACENCPHKAKGQGCPYGKGDCPHARGESMERPADCPCAQGGCPHAKAESTGKPDNPRADGGCPKKKEGGCPFAK